MNLFLASFPLKSWLNLVIVCFLMWFMKSQVNRFISSLSKSLFLEITIRHCISSIVPQTDDISLTNAGSQYCVYSRKIIIPRILILRLSFILSFYEKFSSVPLLSRRFNWTLIFINRKRCFLTQIRFKGNMFSWTIKTVF